MRKLKVLIACEFSGVVRDQFGALGHDAWSCDLLPSISKGNHVQGDVSGILDEGWDLMIAHPPCTYLCRGGLNWINRIPGRIEEMHKAISFVKSLMAAPIPKIAIENPIGKLSTHFRKPDQIVYAYQFGHPFTKDICLWLKGLPKLKTTHYIDPKKCGRLDFWSTDRKMEGGQDKKSITFKGLAEAMADQWSKKNLNKYIDQELPFKI
jgi:hypothetical protein